MNSTLLALAPLGLVAFIVFIISPFSNVLNIITVPLGYEWQSCPYCPDVGIKKITTTECEHCGDEHAENWGASYHPAGTDSPTYRFCSSECMYEWKDSSAASNAGGEH